MAQKKGARAADEEFYQKQDFDGFTRAIGRAITDWQFVEKGLGMLFRILSASTSEQIAGAIFSSPRDFSQKLTLVHNVARYYFRKNADWMAAWDALRLRLVAESEFRNAFAHFSLHDALDINDETGLLEGTIELRPNSLDPNEPFRRRRKELASMKKAEIEAADERFQLLFLDLARFQHALERRQAKPPAPSAPSPRVKDNQQGHQRQHPPGRGRPRRSSRE